MFNKKLQEKISRLENKLYEETNKINEFHQVCAACGITGHKVDMVAGGVLVFSGAWYWSADALNTLNNSVNEFYHKDCYAKKFNKHLCSCGCGKWLDNEKKDCK